MCQPTPTPRRRNRRAAIVAAACLGITLAMSACGSPDPASAAEGDPEVSTELVPVTRGDVDEQKRANGQVGFGPILQLPIFVQGLITWAPEQNTVLSPGDVAIMVDNKPVVLVAGEMPMYRELRQVPFFQTDRAGNPVGLQTGPDVDQLQAFLIAGGFDEDGTVATEDAFGPSTDRALRAWQASVGHSPDGITNDTQIAFVDQDIRVESDLAVGQIFTNFQFTGTDLILTIDAPAIDREFFAVDQPVEVSTEAGTVEGTVIKSTRTADPNGGSARQTILVLVEGVDPDRLGEVAEVVGTRRQASDVLTVPVRALLALTEGGWAVEVAGGDDETDFRSVELVEVVDTTAIITGLDEGTEIVVPR